jgi:hypothetical protein
MADIFICYRHDDSAGWVRALYNELKGRFGPRRVFIDHNIPGGTKFPVRIMNEIQRASVFLVVIGKDWLPASTWDRSRLESPDDWVRQEIAAALKRRKISIIPVLVHGASMPERSRLPSDLAPLLQWNAVHVRDNSWDQNVTELVRMIEKQLPAPAVKGGSKAGPAKNRGAKQGLGHSPAKAVTTVRTGTGGRSTSGRKKSNDPLAGEGIVPASPKRRKPPAQTGAKAPGTSGSAKAAGAKRPSPRRRGPEAQEETLVSRPATPTRPTKSTAAPVKKRATKPATEARLQAKKPKSGGSAGSGRNTPKKQAAANSRKKR